MSDYETALAYFRDRPDEVDVIQGDARAAQEHAAAIVRGLMAEDVVALPRAEWDEIKVIAERWPSVQSELKRLRVDDELAYDLAADLCDQGARPARSTYHPGAWNRVSRVDSKHYEQHALDVIQHIRKHPKASADEWFVIDLAANLCDLCQRPRRAQFSAAAWDQATREEAGPPGSRKSEWWLAYARQVIERIQAARSTS